MVAQIFDNSSMLVAASLILTCSKLFKIVGGRITSASKPKIWVLLSTAFSCKTIMAAPSMVWASSPAALVGSGLGAKGVSRYESSTPNGGIVAGGVTLSPGHGWFFVKRLSLTRYK